LFSEVKESWFTGNENIISLKGGQKYDRRADS